MFPSDAREEAQSAAVGLPPTVPQKKQPSTQPQNVLARLRALSEELSALSIFLSLIAVCIVAFSLKGSNLNEVAIEKLTKAIEGVLLAAAGLTWLVCGNSKKLFNRYAFLTFSASCLVGAAFFAYFSNGAVKESERQDATVRMLGTNALMALEDAKSGKPFNVKSTGDAEIDATLQVVNGFTKEVSTSLESMDDEIDALHKESVFSTKVLGSKTAIEAELAKRLESRVAIQLCSEKLVPLIEATKAKAAALQVSGEISRGAMEGIENGLTKSPLKETFSLRMKREMSEFDFLKFLQSNFGEYEMREGEIIFKNPVNAIKYNELAQAIDAATKEATNFQQLQMRAIDAAKVNMQNLAH
jgi:hypothetical protein